MLLEISGLRQTVVPTRFIPQKGESKEVVQGDRIGVPVEARQQAPASRLAQAQFQLLKNKIGQWDADAIEFAPHLMRLSDETATLMEESFAVPGVSDLFMEALDSVEFQERPYGEDEKMFAIADWAYRTDRLKPDQKQEVREKFAPLLSQRRLGDVVQSCITFHRREYLETHRTSIESFDELEQLALIAYHCRRGPNYDQSLNLWNALSGEHQEQVCNEAEVRLSKLGDKYPDFETQALLALATNEPANRPRFAPYVRHQMVVGPFEYKYPERVAEIGQVAMDQYVAELSDPSKKPEALRSGLITASLAFPDESVQAHQKERVLNAWEKVDGPWVREFEVKFSEPGTAEQFAHMFADRTEADWRKAEVLVDLLVELDREGNFDYLAFMELRKQTNTLPEELHPAFLDKLQSVGEMTQGDTRQALGFTRQLAEAVVAGQEMDQAYEALLRKRLGMEDPKAEFDIEYEIDAIDIGGILVPIQD